MASIARIARLVGAALGAVLGVWYRAVLYAPEVRRRKELRRARSVTARRRPDRASRAREHPRKR